MAVKSGSTQRVKLLDEIIDNAAGLPLEKQDALLMMAKAMKYTRDSMECSRMGEQKAWENVFRDGR